MKARHLLMAAGLCVAAWLAIFGNKRPASDIVEPVAHVAAVSKDAPAIERTTQSIPSGSGAMQTPEILALQDRGTLFGGTHNKSPGKGLFGSRNWMPPALPPPKPAPPPPPMAPPLPFTYIGKKLEGSRWEVYVTHGEQVHIVHENAIVENIYHIDSIKPPTMTLTYLPLQQVQTLTIGETD
jgi:hypothetical protein